MPSLNSKITIHAYEDMEGSSRTTKTFGTLDPETYEMKLPKRIAGRHKVELAIYDKVSQDNYCSKNPYDFNGDHNVDIVITKDLKGFEQVSCVHVQ